MTAGTPAAAAVAAATTGMTRTTPDDPLAPDSWACVHDTTVRQAGARRLFDEVLSAYTWWQHAGRPHRERYGVTITVEGQSVWLDDPAWRVVPVRDRELTGMGGGTPGRAGSGPSRSW